MRAFHGNCGHCGVPFVRKPQGRIQRYCSSRCFHRAYRNRRKGLPEDTPVRARDKTTGLHGSIWRCHDGWAYRLRFNKVAYDLYHGPDREVAERIQRETSRLVNAGQWQPPPKRYRPVGYIGTTSESYGLYFFVHLKRNGKRYRVPLGRSSDGWTHELAEAERQRIEEEIKAGTWKPPVARSERSEVFAAEACERIERDVAKAIESFERRTHREALPHLQMLRELASTLRKELTEVAA